MIATYATLSIFFFIPRQLIPHIRLVITDDKLTVNSQEPWIVQLSGVDSFYTDKYNGRKIIGIRYKDNIADGITDAEIAKDRKERRKSPLTGYPYEIYVGGLAMSQQKLCDLLNSKLVHTN